MVVTSHGTAAMICTRTGIRVLARFRGNEADLASGVVYINGVRVVNRGDKKVAA